MSAPLSAPSDRFSPAVTQIISSSFHPSTVVTAILFVVWVNLLSFFIIRFEQAHLLWSTKDLLKVDPAQGRWLGL